jgi:hypothetical protein
MTTTFIATLWLLLAATAATAAAEPLAVPKTGVCPSGYASSGSYCTPTSDRAPRAIPKVGVCPGDWSSSGAYCVEPQRPR